MEFRKYQHIERFGCDEVQGIELGVVWVFPKIDGTNGSVWLDNGNLCAGSRNREVSLDNDNRGFYGYVLNDKRIAEYLLLYPHRRLFGEWLVPHSLKTYRDEAWNRFYIFDVCLDAEDGLEYIPFEIYEQSLKDYNLDYIPPIASIKNGSYDQLVDQLEKNVFLIEDGKGAGEGIVIKNYDYKNRFGRQKWAKIVRSEFKEVHTKEMGAASINGKKMVEESICEKYCTQALVDKTFDKIRNENGGWTSKYIPKLLGLVWYELIIEESWNFVKEFKNPTINYSTLNHFIINKIKELKPTIF